MIASNADPSLRLRIPEPLKKKVEKSAKREGRSLNSEILIVLSDRYKLKLKP